MAGEEVARGDYVRVLKARSEPRFIEQEGGQVWIAHVLPVEALDCYGPRKPRVASEQSEVHHRHSSGCELRMEFVPANEQGSMILHAIMIARTIAIILRLFRSRLRAAARQATSGGLASLVAKDG
jgi:uncharacterized membrane protein